nr:unnamed protein product [Callosobruchus analis]
MDFRIGLYVCIVYFSTYSGVFTAYLNPLRFKEVKCNRNDVGKQLILTPLLEQGKIEEARTAATVHLSGKAKKIRSYAGYFTVNKKYNSNLYFWFFPSNGDHTKDPVLLWLQGGPGASSMYGLLEESGPIAVNKDLQLDIRNYSWTNNHSVIYIDNPVGVGFSFTDHEDGYARNETQIGNELYNALQQFFTLFPELRKNYFFITGASYAGKYISVLAYTIHRSNASANEKINLKGVAIGNGYIDPTHQIGFAEYAYQLGLVDKNTSDIVRIYENKGKCID